MRAISCSVTLLVALVSVSSVSAQEPSDQLSIDAWRIALTEGHIDERRLAAQRTRDLSPSVSSQLLPEFIELLRHEKDGQIRLAIFDTLTELGPRAAIAVPALVNAIRQNYGGRYNEELHQDYRAALAMASIGKEAVEGLRNLLNEEAENMRAEAAMALGLIGASAASAVPDLLLLLDDESDPVRKDAVRALGNIGEPSVTGLLINVQDESPGVRAATIESLIQAAPEDKRVRQAVTSAVRDDDAVVRAAATAGLDLIDLDESKSAKLLLVSLHDDASDVRIAAINVLSKRPKLLRRLIPELSELLVGESDDVAWHAAFLLQPSGLDALPHIVLAAENPNSRIGQLAEALALVGSANEHEFYQYLTASKPSVQRLAILTLGRIQPVQSETVELLSHRLRESPDELLTTYLEGLSFLGKRAIDAIPDVRQLLPHKDPVIRLQVAEIIFNAATRDEQLVKDLTQLAGDQSAEVQRTAIESLKSLGPLGRAAIPTVITAVGSTDQSVRGAALDFVGSHGASASASVPQLQQQLHESSDVAWKVAVIETLGRMGPSAQSVYEELVNGLGAQSAAIRAASIGTLARIDLSSAKLFPHLLTALTDSDEEVSDQAASSIRRLGAKGSQLVPDLIRLLSHEESKESVTRLLDRLERYQPDVDSIPDLVELTGHKDRAIQLRAIRFIGLAGSPAASANSQLKYFLNHDDEAIRAEATKALESINR